MGRALFLFPLAAFVLLLAYFAMGLQRDPSIIPTVLIDKPVPEFDLSPIEGYENGLSSEDLKDEVTLVNIFWLLVRGLSDRAPVVDGNFREESSSDYGAQLERPAGERNRMARQARRSLYADWQRPRRPGFH